MVDLNEVEVSKLSNDKLETLYQAAKSEVSQDRIPLLQQSCQALGSVETSFVLLYCEMRKRGIVSASHKPNKRQVPFDPIFNSLEKMSQHPLFSKKKPPKTK